MRLLFLVCALLNNILAGALANLLSGLFATFCSVQGDGQNYCWGRNYQGQLGNGASHESPFPVKMLNVQNATSLAVGAFHTCIVDQGKARCTGHYFYLGRSSSSDSINILVDVEGMDPSDTVEQVFANEAHSCLITSTGGAKCWGSNDSGRLGNTVTSSYQQPFPVIGFETSGVVTMALGNKHTCLINTSGKVYCAGSNDNGQLGPGTRNTNTNSAMQPITGSAAVAETMVSIACGELHTCTVSATGSVYCWGAGYYGQLGQANTTDLYTPTIVPGLSNIAMVWCGWGNTFVVLKNNQSVKGFGQNSGGQLGLGSDTTNKLSPVTVFADQTNIVDIKGGKDTTCILLESGMVRCFGLNAEGQLGNDVPMEESMTFVDVLYLPTTPLPTSSPTLPTASPTLPTASPTLPTTSPTLPTTSPTLPTDSPTLPTTSPTLPTASPTLPTDSPTLPTSSPTLPTASPTLRTDSPTTVEQEQQDLFFMG